MLCPKHRLAVRNLTAANEPSQRIVLIPVVVCDIAGTIHHLAAPGISVAVIDIDLSIVQRTILCAVFDGHDPPVTVIGVGFIIPVGIRHL